MAKKAAPKKINKSAKIREYLEKHPTVKPKEAAGTLSIDLGVAISPASVSQIKTKMGKSKTGAAGKKKKAAKKDRHELDLVALQIAFKLIEASGSRQKAINTLTAACKIHAWR